MSQSILYDKALDSDTLGLEIKVYQRKLRIFYAVLAVLILVLLIVCVLLVFLFGGVHKKSSLLPVVTKLKCGWIKGKINDGVVEYLGIPYAYPPTATRRFVHAQEIIDRRGCSSLHDDPANPYEANAYKSACIQYDRISDAIIGSEDCLYLNIFTPASDLNKKLPVIFVVSGIFFSYGSGNMSGLTVLPEVIKATNAIHVTFNYRMGPMSSIISPETNETNHGLSDVLSCLKWVHKNVALFGGDPSNVVLYGVGSGSTIALVLYNSNKAANLFSKLWISNPITRITTDFQAALQRQKTHLIDEKKMKVFQEKLTLQKIFANWTWTNIEDMLKYKWFHFPNPNTSTIFDNDNVHFLLIDNDFITDSNLLKRMLINRNVPIVIGNNANEVDIFPSPVTVRYWNMEFFKEIMEMEMKSHFKFVDEDVFETFLQQYDKNQVMTPEDIYTKTVTDIRITCPLNSLLTKLMGFSHGPPIYRYILEDHHSYLDYFNMKYSNGLAAHGWDSILYFRGYKTHGDYGPYGEKEMEMSEVLNRVMYNFAWTDELKDMSVSKDGYVNMNLIRDGKILRECYIKTKECKFWESQMGDTERFMWTV